MWRTFYQRVQHMSQIDSFLNTIEDSGYDPAFIREQWAWARNEYGGPIHVLDVMVTARKKEQPCSITIPR